MKREEEGDKAAAKSGGLKLKQQCKYKFTPNKVSVQKPLLFKATFVWKGVSLRPPEKKNCEEEFPSTDIYEGIYNPKTDETRAAYDEMFSIIQKPIAGNPLSTVRSIVNGIIVLLKNDAVDNHVKKRDINLILNPIPDHVFDRLVSIAMLLTDYQPPDTSAYRRRVGIIDITPPLENHIFK